MSEMARYLAYQIILQVLKYDDVIKKHEKHKETIDRIIDDMGWKIDAAGNCIGKKG